MKKFKRMLAGLARVLAGCPWTPTPFSAKGLVYFYANGGLSLLNHLPRRP